MSFHYDFSGDGRLKRTPPLGAIGNPMSVTNSQARLIIGLFEESGVSAHSGQGATLWVLLDHCEKNAVPYVLKAMPGMGYEIRKMDGEVK